MSYMDTEEAYAEMVDRPLKSVALDKAKDSIRFGFADGSTVVFSVEGGCCSHSWIEHLSLPSPVGGAVIASWDEPEMPTHDGHVCEEPPEGSYTRPSCDHDSLAVYHTRFRTQHGDIVMEYRNDSNGYYGGWVSVDSQEWADRGAA